MSSTMIPDLVVGEVGFGSNFAPEADFYRAQAGQLGLQVADLEAEVAELIRQRNRLRRASKSALRCRRKSPTRSTKSSSKPTQKIFTGSKKMIDSGWTLLDTLGHTPRHTTSLTQCHGNS